MPTSVRSHTKINLGLAIGPLRPDGFHQLTTVYQTLALHEWVTVEARMPPRPASRSAAVIRASPPMPAIPRGGWWNAAWRCSISTPKSTSTSTSNSRCKAAWAGAQPTPWPRSLVWSTSSIAGFPGRPPALAAEIGSDVPLFLLGGAVVGVGHGEEVYPLPDIPSMPCVIALPDIGRFYPAGLPGLGRLAFVDPGAPSATIEGVESVDRCCIWRTALLRCLLR